MAQTGYTPISIYYSTTAATAPSSSNLASGELAINITDGKLYYKDTGGTVRLLASNATSTPVTTISFGSTGLTPATATSGAVSVAGTLATANGGTNLTSFTSGGAVYATSTSALTTGTLPIASGGTGATTLAGANIAVTNVANTFTALQTFAGSTTAASLKTDNIKEVATISATSATGTINFDVLTQSVLYYTAAASGNWTINFRGSSTATLDSIMSVGESISTSTLIAQGATAYYNSAIQVDGTSTGVTTVWQSAAPTSGDINALDTYTYVIIKTASATFTVLATQTKFV
jgi:hypothetical protein